MFIHACMHVRMYVCMYVCMHVCMYVYVCLFVYVCMYVGAKPPRGSDRVQWKAFGATLRLVDTSLVCIYIYIYGGNRKVGTCPQEQVGPKPQVPTLISEAKLGTWSETRQRESWNLYCRERGTAITTTAPVLQRKRNYNCYDRSSIANS